MAPIFSTLTLLGVGLMFAALVWPEYGIMPRCRLKKAAASKTIREDVLKHLCKCEANRTAASFESVAGAAKISPDAAGLLLHEMEQEDLVTFASGSMSLTSKGRRCGTQMIRAHRLWESHLAENTGVPESDWHMLAEVAEHGMTPEQTEALAVQLGHPARDPHGDPIPPADGILPAATGQALTKLAPGMTAIILHLEDEPTGLYTRIAALNLRPGMRVELKEKSSAGIRFTADGTEHTIPPILAHQIEVQVLFKDARAETRRNLSDFKPGESAKVLGLATGCRGPERRRLLDLGFVPGTAVAVEMVSPSGEPTAYVVRGTVIALHREQAGLVLVEASGKAS